MFKRITLYFVSFLSVLWVFFSPVHVFSQTVEVEVGPEFGDNDVPTTNSCYVNAFADKFPFDFVGFFDSPRPGYDLTLNEIECPNLTIFGYSHEFCWAIEAFLLIEPAVLIGLISYGIFHL